MQIILIDPEQADFATTKVKLFIEYDLADHNKDDLHVDNICFLIRERNLKIDGCVTFWESCSALAAAVCERLGLTGLLTFYSDPILSYQSWCQSQFEH